ncbi:MAG: helicase C-terminal domain-containing protein [Elusimicrobiota bacterium]
MKNYIDDVFDDKGLLEKTHKNYESRPQQRQMAVAVEHAIAKNCHLIVEAGTGIGKTLAYLVPFIYWSTEKKSRVIISTYTKTLQEQIYNKDLPFLQKILPVDFKFSLCVGSENYICIRRLSRYYQLGPTLAGLNDEDTLEKVMKWVKKTTTGLKLEIDFPVSFELWHSICRETDMCLGKKCTFSNKKECFYSKAKAQQYNSNILVSNHHLFFANIASGGRILPKYHAVVFDEAQNIEEVASDQLGINISNTGLNYILSRIYNPKKDSGFHRLIKLSFTEKEQFVNDVATVRSSADLFFSELLSKFGTEPKVQRIKENPPWRADNTLEQSIARLVETLKKFCFKTEDEEILAEIKSYSSSLVSLNDDLNTIIGQIYDDYVYWIEISQKHRLGIKIALRAAPIDVSKILSEDIFKKISPVILTSATLASDPLRHSGSPLCRSDSEASQKFSFIKERLGITESDELVLDSPFDYRNKVILYIPENIPDPKYEPEEFNKKSFEEIKKILEITNGRTFCLFTSYKMLNDIYEHLSALPFATGEPTRKEEGLPHGKKYEIFRQGELPKWKMLDGFKKSKNAVLLGTDTFWQGVDVPGRALECVIITRLPFAAPDDPLTEAKMEYLKKLGKNPFMHYQIPHAIIMLKQGFGRLIRRQSDVGIVAILDPRVKTRRYGEKFLRSLPDCKNVSSIEELKSGYEDLLKNLTKRCDFV